MEEKGENEVYGLAGKTVAVLPTSQSVADHRRFRQTIQIVIFSDCCVAELFHCIETRMAKIVECVPNFSEGRDPQVVKLS